MQTRKPHLLRLFGRFGRDRRAVSAVEFALVAPLMITLYFGCVEVSDGVAADRKVSLTAATLANLAAQETSISSSQMDNILAASTAIIAPYDVSRLKVTLSC
ncbi:MAG: pilus assembly protein, partial [Pseudolabrys sp.]